jgi:predicted ATP-grasp superfamily ATP-dependent carboligase
VLKPVDGAGSLRTYLVDAPADIPDRDTEMVLQPFQRGEPLSATYLVSPLGSIRLIGVGWQRVTVRSGLFVYEGGRLPAPAEFAAGGPTGAVRGVAGLRGVVGVDFLRDPSTGETTVLEINPRPTTSYVGLVRLLPPGTIARAWLDAFRDGAPGDDLRGMIPPGVPQRVEFRADGSIVG